MVSGVVVTTRACSVPSSASQIAQSATSQTDSPVCRRKDPGLITASSIARVIQQSPNVELRCTSDKSSV